jgi:hypothetical protein
MGKSVSEKLSIKPNSTLLTLHAPVNFKRGLEELPVGVQIIPFEKKPGPENYNQVHWFVENKAQLDKEVKKVMQLMKPEVTIWVYYPKATSGIQTDLTRDKGWDKIMAEKDKLTWINLISYDDTWSVFGFRAKSEKDLKKVKKPVAREIFNWANPVTKEIKIPADLANAFKKNKKQNNFFHSLSFTNKKEYIEWIVTAKKEETRKERIDGTIERLGKQWKNPGNR